jgi:hypothetical protein
MSAEQPLHERVKGDSIPTLLDTVRRFPNTPEGQASAHELTTREVEGKATHREEVVGLLGSMRKDLDGIHGHAKRPEWKSWTFLIAVLALIVAIFSLLRDWFDWRFPFPFPSQKASESIPQQRSESRSRETLTLGLPPSSTNATPSEESRPAGSPAEAKTSPCESPPVNCD